MKLERVGIRSPTQTTPSSPSAMGARSTPTPRADGRRRSAGPSTSPHRLRQSAATAMLAWRTLKQRPQGPSDVQAEGWAAGLSGRAAGLGWTRNTTLSCRFQARVVAHAEHEVAAVLRGSNSLAVSWADRASPVESNIEHGSTGAFRSSASLQISVGLARQAHVEVGDPERRCLSPTEVLAGFPP
jgi:hypothetical protein